MRRAAILIGSPGNNPFLPGTLADVQRYRDFLLSPYGGAWRDSEITSFESPCWFEVEAALAEASGADYVFLSFSGHGQHNSLDLSTGTVVQLNECEPPVPVHLLNPRGPSHTLVVDACRELAPWLFEKVGGLAGLIEEKVAKRAPSLEACRRLFDQRCTLAGVGRVVMYSCQVRQTAGEPDDGSGGYFSRFLVDDAVTVAADALEPAWLSVPAAFAAARDHTFAINAPQRAVLENGRRNVDFPFAVVAW